MALKPIAYVQAAWHTDITEHCKTAFVAELAKYGYGAGDVAQAVLQGIVQTSLETEVPVLSAVLTPHHFHEHAVHEEFFRTHMEIKGRELAEACASIVEKLSAVAALA